MQGEPATQPLPAYPFGIAAIVFLIIAFLPPIHVDGYEFVLSYVFLPEAVVAGIGFILLRASRPVERDQDYELVSVPGVEPLLANVQHFRPTHIAPVTSPKAEMDEFDAEMDRLMKAMGIPNEKS